MVILLTLVSSFRREQAFPRVSGWSRAEMQNSSIATWKCWLSPTSPGGGGCPKFCLSLSLCISPALLFLCLSLYRLRYIERKRFAPTFYSHLALPLTFSLSLPLSLRLFSQIGVATCDLQPWVCLWLSLSMSDFIALTPFLSSSFFLLFFLSRSILSLSLSLSHHLSLSLTLSLSSLSLCCLSPSLVSLPLLSLSLSHSLSLFCVCLFPISLTLLCPLSVPSLAATLFPPTHKHHGSSPLAEWLSNLPPCMHPTDAAPHIMRAQSQPPALAPCSCTAMHSLASAAVLPAPVKWAAIARSSPMAIESSLLQRPLCSIKHYGYLLTAARSCFKRAHCAGGILQFRPKSGGWGRPFSCPVCKVLQGDYIQLEANDIFCIATPLCDHEASRDVVTLASGMCRTEATAFD